MKQFQPRVPWRHRQTSRTFYSPSGSKNKFLMLIIFAKYFIWINFRNFMNFVQIHQNLSRETKETLHSRKFIQEKFYELIVQKK